MTSEPTPTLGHRIEHAGFLLASGLLRAFPERAALGLGALLGDTAGRLVRVRRRVVEENLDRAFPERSASWRRRTALAAYRHVGREGVTLLRLSRMDREEVRSRTRLEGSEALAEAVEEGRGAIVVSGHFGNWEIGGAALAVRGIPLDVVAVRQKNPLFDRHLVAARERLGMRVVEKGRAPREVLRSLRRGRVVALVADQNVRSGGVFVDFFGVPAATARGPALFGLRSGAPVFLGMAIREPGSRASYRVVLDRIPTAPRSVTTGDVGEGGRREDGGESAGRGTSPAADTGGGEEAVRRLTEAHTRGLERFVRQHPEQYFWHHRRWKTRPGARGAGAVQEPRSGGNVLFSRPDP